MKKIPLFLIPISLFFTIFLFNLIFETKLTLTEGVIATLLIVCTVYSIIYETTLVITKNTIRVYHRKKK